MSVLFTIWLLGALWTAQAASRTTRALPFEIFMCVLSAVLWPLFWPVVIYMAITGKYE